MRYTTTIVSGHGRGKFLGYPTLNMVIPNSFSQKQGIYAGYVWIDDKQFLGAFHYGPVPTFDQTELSLEVFVLDANISKNIHGISFELVHYLRPVASFSDKEALIKQIKADVIESRKLLESL